MQKNNQTVRKASFLFDFFLALCVFVMLFSSSVAILTYTTTSYVQAQAQNNDEDNEVEPSDAITEDDINSLLENTEFYDPKAEPCTNTASNISTSGSNDAYIIGDSISYGLELDGIKGKLADKLGGNVTVNYDSGRTITSGGSQVGTSALDAVDNDKNVISQAGVVVIVLGTNLGDDPFLENMNELLEKLKSEGYAPNATYYWVDIGANRSDNAEAWSERNRTIYDNAASAGYSVISRYKAIFGQDKDPLNIDSSLPFPGGGDSVHGAYSRLSEAIVNGVQAGNQPNTSQSGNCTCSEAGVTTLTGSNVAEQFWNYLVNNLGFTAPQAAGIMGNVERESGFVPTAVNTQSGAYGLIQWFQGRLTGLENYAREQGKDKSDVGIQLEYMKIELESSYRETVYEPIKATDDMGESLRIWLENYEIPCIAGSSQCAKEISERLPFAQNYLALYGSNNGAVIGSSSVGCITDSSGTVVGDYSLPVDRTWYDQQPDWFTKPHHDYPAADIPVPEGTPIYSMTAGTVIVAPAGDACGLGVIIESPEGHQYTYCHGSDGGAVEGARQGDVVKAGQLIMHSSWTGNVIPPSPQGTHLHLGIRVSGNSVCPQDLFVGIVNGAIPAVNSLPTGGCTY